MNHSLTKAAFAAGCFWHVQADFKKLKGVKKTIVGYMGGKVKKPSYVLVCTGLTGHAETLYLEYDEKIISYDKLLNLFWKIHNPTHKNRQGLNVGTQYRSVIFYYNIEQKKKAQASLKKLEKKLGKKVATKITKATEFYKAEEYHQDYYEKQNK